MLQKYINLCVPQSFLLLVSKFLFIIFLSFECHSEWITSSGSFYIDRNTFKETVDEGLAIMAVDNLPSELPRDSSREFGDGIVSEVIPYILNEDDGRILNATITQNGSFLEKYNYLNDYIKKA